METDRAFVGGYVAQELKDELQKLAIAEDRSVNWLLKKILVEGVNHRRKKKNLPRKGRSSTQDQ